MGLRDKFKRLEGFAGRTVASKSEQEVRKRAAEEKRSAMLRRIEEAVADAQEKPKPPLSPEDEELEEMWEATWGHLKRRG